MLAKKKIALVTMVSTRRSAVKFENNLKRLKYYNKCVNCVVIYKSLHT